MIILKTKFEGSLNLPCAKHNEGQRESRRVCEPVTEQAVDKGIPTETCIHDLKKKTLIYSIIKNGEKKMYITEEINIKNCLPPRIEPGHSAFRDLCVST